MGDRFTERSAIRRLLFRLSVPLAIVACAEIGAQGVIRTLPGASPFRRVLYPSRFTLHRFTSLVNDPRIAVPTPGYRGEVATGASLGSRAWNVEIDGNGFRAPANYGGKTKVIAFLGDSVPFGWGIPDGATTPARFQELLRTAGMPDIGVLNAAVPSYSLFQAVEHFERQVAGRYPLHSVVLQVLDPAIQFSLHGEAWHPGISGVTRDRDPSHPILGAVEAVVEQSVLLNIALRAAYRTAPMQRPSGNLTRSAWESFDRANEDTLARLLRQVRKDGGQLVLVSANPGPEPTREYSERERHVIQHFNTVLKGFADRHADVFYVDARQSIAETAAEALFIDRCCHLSVLGAQQQAQLLFEHFTKGGLLP